MSEFIEHEFAGWVGYKIPILKSLLIPQGQCILFEGYAMMHHEDYIQFATSLHAWDSALDALRELIHYKIDTNSF